MDDRSPGPFGRVGAQPAAEFLDRRDVPALGPLPLLAPPAQLPLPQAGRAAETGQAHLVGIHGVQVRQRVHQDVGDGVPLLRRLRPPGGQRVANDVAVDLLHHVERHADQLAGVLEQDGRHGHRGGRQRAAAPGPPGPCRAPAAAAGRPAACAAPPRPRRWSARRSGSTSRPRRGRPRAVPSRGLPGPARARGRRGRAGSGSRTSGPPNRFLRCLPLTLTVRMGHGRRGRPAAQPPATTPGMRTALRVRSVLTGLGRWRLLPPSCSASHPPSVLEIGGTAPAYGWSSA